MGWLPPTLSSIGPHLANRLFNKEGRSHRGLDDGRGLLLRYPPGIFFTCFFSSLGLKCAPAGAARAATVSAPNAARASTGRFQSLCFCIQILPFPRPRAVCP